MGFDVSSLVSTLVVLLLGGLGGKGSKIGAVSELLIGRAYNK